MILNKIYSIYNTILHCTYNILDHLLLNFIILKPAIANGTFYNDENNENVPFCMN